MSNEGSEVKKNSKTNLAGKKGKIVAGENGLKNGPIENGLIQWSHLQRSMRCINERWVQQKILSIEIFHHGFWSYSKGAPNGRSCSVAHFSRFEGV